MIQRLVVAFLLALTVLVGSSAAFAADAASPVVVFREPGFPADGVIAPSAEQLSALLPDAGFATAEQLPAALKAARVLVMPYGSAFPEAAWADLYSFLQRGGNLVVIGGRPFTRAAYRDAAGWKLRDYSVRYTRPLMIDQYEATPGSAGLQYVANPDLPERLPAFAWQRGFSPVIRLSARDLYQRGGSAGAIDARVDALAWGVQGGRKMAAPAIQVDHLRNGFDGGRWLFVNAELGPEFYQQGGGEIVRTLVARALMGSEEFVVRPEFPLYLPGEPVQLEVVHQSAAAGAAMPAATLRITRFAQDAPADRMTSDVPLDAWHTVVLAAPKSGGFHVIEAELRQGGKVRAVYRSGFWVRDEAALRSGPKLTVNQDYFELDGAPLAVVGTTYMSSEVQRLFFDHPNAYVWDQDMAQIRGAGLNMIRSGWWTGWDKLCDETGRPYERTLRTLEAFLLTARKHGLPVQFNFFAFLPDVLGGANPYLDGNAVRRQQTLVTSVAARFRDVPWLVWDLINEPSISQHLWTMRPNGDGMELAQWNEWINQKYADRAALAAAWNVPLSEVQGTVALPGDAEFNPRSMYVGRNSLKLHDYEMFAQGVFRNWARGLREAIRATGSQQLVTVGQDEGGIADRPSPAYWSDAVDFTTNHSWWQNDDVLWNSLLAKQPGKAMLIQETGLQRELNLDESARRTTENESALLERKIAASFVQGSGAIEWLWNTNSYMTESNETPIGAVRPDGTEKPEATVLRGYAAVAKGLGARLKSPQRPAIAIVTSQAAQYSALADLQIEAQRKAVRALAYEAHLPVYVIAENRLESLGTPKLVILPSPQALTEKAWQTLLVYVSKGGHLLVTGPLDRDEHWARVARAGQVIPGAQSEPLTVHNATVELPGRSIPLGFDLQKQSWLEAAQFGGGNWQEAAHGAGRIYWAAYPVELASDTSAAAELYRYVAGRAGVAPGFELLTPLPAGVAVIPTVMQDAVLYVMLSDRATDVTVDLRDAATGARVTVPLAGQHAALAVVGKAEKAVVARYGY